MKKGFSIIEFLVVLFLTGIILSLGNIAFINASSTSKINTSSQTIVTMLRCAREIAIIKKCAYIVDFDSKTLCAKIKDENNNIYGKVYYLPEGIIFGNSPGKLDDIKFLPNGRAIKFGGGAAINSIWIVPEKNKNKGSRITVHPVTGRIKIKKNQKKP